MWSRARWKVKKNNRSGEEGRKEKGRRALLTCGAERVCARELPHAGDELCEAPNEEGHADDDVGRRDVARLDVEHRQDERRRCESEQTPARIDGKKKISGCVEQDGRARGRTEDRGCRACGSTGRCWDSMSTPRAGGWRRARGRPSRGGTWLQAVGGALNEARGRRAGEEEQRRQRKLAAGKKREAPARVF